MVWCSGELKGDPDIAGVGVTRSIWITAAISIILSFFLWFYTYLHRLDAENSTYKRLLKCAFVLADIELVTAGAIVWSSIILIHSESETSLYHVFIARSLTQATLAGHGAALLFDTRRQANWHVRIALLTVVLISYLYWTVISIREFDAWSHTTPKGFYNNSRVPGWYTDWMKLDIIWAILSYQWVYAEAAGSIVALHLVRFDLSIAKIFWLAINKLRNIPQRPISGFPILVISLLELFFVVLAAIVVGPPCTLPFASTFFLLWCIYDGVTARNANQHILTANPVNLPNASLQGNTNPENDWGFGQLLPLFLLVLPMVSGLFHRFF
jgi:hypothetical protein